MARLASLLIYAARRDGELPFTLSCQPFPADSPQKPLCDGRARFVLASLDPRALTDNLDPQGCADDKGKPIANCFDLTFARTPDVYPTYETERWRLRVNATFPGGDIDRIPEIRSVTLQQEDIIIE